MSARKHRVAVWLVARKRVEMDVEVEEGDEPTDLTAAEQQRARLLVADSSGVPAREWDVDEVIEVTT